VDGGGAEERRNGLMAKRRRGEVQAYIATVPAVFKQVVDHGLDIGEHCCGSS
jgi:hypothetical protein